MSFVALFDAYERAAAELIPRFEAVEAAQVLAPIVSFLPDPGAYILDVGAGTGRDAAWLARRGYNVWAAEPVDALRHAGRTLHRSDKVHWLADGFPDLAKTSALDRQFDLVLVNAVWHHLPPEQRADAMQVLALLVASKGQLILSLRSGPSHPDRQAYPADVPGAIRLARSCGMTLVQRRDSAAIQAQNRTCGVVFNWLVFSRE